MKPLRVYVFKSYRSKIHCKECKRDFHVLEPVQGCTEVEVFNIQAHVLGTFSAEYTVPHQFWSGEVSSACGQLSWIVDQVPPGCDSYSVQVGLLRLKIYNHAHMCDCLILGDEGNLSVSHDKNWIWSFCLVLLLPCAMPPKPFPNAVCQILLVAGSCVNFL